MPESPGDDLPLRLAGPAALSEAAVHLLKDARRSLVLFSDDLEPALYGGTEFVAGIEALILKVRRVRIRILVRNPLDAIRNRHRLLILAQRLSSFIEMRRPEPDYPISSESYMVVDEVAYLYRADPPQREAVASARSPRRATELLLRFEEAWVHASLDPDLRRLYL